MGAMTTGEMEAIEECGRLIQSGGKPHALQDLAEI